MLVLGREGVALGSVLLVEQEELDEVLHVLQRPMVSAVLQPVRVDLVAYLLTPPQVAQVLKQPRYTKGQIRFHAALPETLLMLRAHPLDEGFE